MGASGENVDAVAARPDATLALSTSGALDEGGLHAERSDLVAFARQRLGPDTRGRLSLLLAGASIGLAGNDITAVAFT